MKLFRLALAFLGLIAIPFVALAQVGPGAPQANLYCESSAGPPPVWQPCSSGNPLAVNASVTVGSVQVTIGSAQNLQWQNGVSLGTPVTWGSTPTGTVISANVNCVAGCSASSGTSPVNLAQVNSATVLVGAGTPQTNSPRMVVAQDSTTIAGSASLPAGTNTIGTANVVNLAGTATIGTVQLTTGIATVGTANVVNLAGTATIGSVAVTTLPSLAAGSAVVGTATVNLTQLQGTALGIPVSWGSTPSGNVLSANVNCITGCSASTLGSAQNIQWQNGTSLGTPVAWGSTPSGVVLSANVNCVAGCSASTGTSPVNLAQVNGATVLVGAGTAQTNTPRVIVAQDSTTVAGSSSLPAGTATIGSVQVSNTNANGQATMANSSPVVIASNQSTLVVQGTASEYPLTVQGTATSYPLSVQGTASTATLGTANVTNLAGTATIGTANVNDLGNFYDNNANFIGGSASATGTAQTTITGTPSTGNRFYITGLQCGRTDAGTTAMYVTLNDKYATVVVLPNNGGGGGNNPPLQSPLVGTPTATPLKFTASAATSTVYCNAQGYQAP